MYKILKAEKLAEKIFLMDVEAPRVAKHCDKIGAGGPPDGMDQQARSPLCKDLRERLELFIGVRPRKRSLPLKDPAGLSHVLKDILSKRHLVHHHLPPVFHGVRLRIMGPGVVFVTHGCQEHCHSPLSSAENAPS